MLDKAHGGPGGEMEKALQRGGFFGESPSPRSGPGGRDLPSEGAGSAVRRGSESVPPDAAPLSLHHLYDGRGANLPWLQEMPDPISTAMWRNWIEVNPKTAAGLGLAEGMA